MSLSQNHVVLFRKEFDSTGEASVAANHLPVFNLRSAVPRNSVVIGRHACLPYYSELVADLEYKGACLINSYAQHSYLANFDYYEDIREHTFRTWFAIEDVPLDVRWGRPFVVERRMKSQSRSESCTSPTSWHSVIGLVAKLANDPTIGPQGYIIREYLPLETLEIGRNRMTFANEWRLYFYKNTLLASSYCWPSIEDLSKVEAARSDFEARGVPFAKMIAGILAERVNFFVIDIARTAEGGWKVAEVTDAQQSRLNHFVNAHELYANLAIALNQAEEINAAFAAMNVCGTTTGRISSREVQTCATPQLGRLSAAMPFEPKRCAKCGEMDFRHPYRNCDIAE